MSGPVTCGHCGKTWPRDPAREVPCPSCEAKVGQQCRRPSGHRCASHVDRDRLALKEVDGYGRCRRGHRNLKPKAKQSGLDAFGGGAE